MTKTKPVFDHSPDGTVTFSLTLPVELIKKEYQHVLLEVQKTTEIKGFRRGKAPLELVEAQSDPSRLYSHVLEHAFPPAYSQFIRVNHLSPLIDPQVVPQKMTLDQDWVMQIKVAVAPQLELGQYQKHVKTALATGKKEQSKDKLLEVVFDALLTHVKLSVSPLLIDEEAKSALTRLATQLASLKVSLTDYAQSIKQTQDEVIAGYKKSVEARLKLHFILDAIQTAQKIPTRQATLDKLCEL